MPTATSPGVFVPLLQRAHDQHSWPAKFDTTGAKVFARITTTAATTSYGQRDAVNFMAFYNTCAWTLQLIQETKAQSGTKDSISALTKLGSQSTPSGDIQQFIGPILSDARLGGLTAANNFIGANDCATAVGR